MYACKSISVLNATNGSRIIAKYYQFDDKLKTKVEQLEFERHIYERMTMNKDSTS